MASSRATPTTTGASAAGMTGSLVLDRNCLPLASKEWMEVCSASSTGRTVPENAILVRPKETSSTVDGGIEPGHDGGNVGVGGAVELSELIGREPLVVVGRRLVLQGGHVLVERGLLRGGRDRRIRTSDSCVDAGASPRSNSALAIAGTFPRRVTRDRSFYGAPDLRGNRALAQ